VLTETFTLLIQLPPLAFGPALPPSPFAPPRELVCPLVGLGRIQGPTPPPSWLAPNASLNLANFAPVPERYLINRPADMLLFLATIYAGRATWDDRPASERLWQATGAVTPVLIPQLAPPAELVKQR
jgi:hypothetical protein